MPLNFSLSLCHSIKNTTVTVLPSGNIIFQYLYKIKKKNKKKKKNLKKQKTKQKKKKKKRTGTKHQKKLHPTNKFFLSDGVR